MNRTTNPPIEHAEAQAFMEEHGILRSAEDWRSPSQIVGGIALIGTDMAQSALDPHQYRLELSILNRANLTATALRSVIPRTATQLW